MVEQPTHHQTPVLSNHPEQDPGQLRCSDIGNAEVFAQQQKDRLRYSPSLGQWLYWDDTAWRTDVEIQLDRLAEETVCSFLSEASEIHDRTDRDDFIKWARRSGSRQRQRAMVEQSRHRLKVDFDDLDRDPTLLCLQRGKTVSLVDGSAHASIPGDYSTKQADVSFNKNAQCPEWLKFLDRIMGSSEPLISYLQKAVGYSLTGKTTEQCFFIAHGSGANGKSVFLNIVRDLAGSYGMNIPMETLMNQKFQSGVSADLAMMRGVRLGTAMEGEIGQKLSEAKVKQLTGGDEITARFLYGNFFQFKPIIKIWMATNHKPQITGDDEAIWRRVHLIPFNVVIPPEERDGDLPNKLREERSGILNWAIEGATRWHLEGLKPPQAVLQAVNDYRSEMDTFDQFCSEAIQTKHGETISKKELNYAYEQWVAVEGGEHLNPSAITQKIRARGFREGRSGTKGRFWRDMALTDYGRSLDGRDF